MVPPVAAVEDVLLKLEAIEFTPVLEMGTGAVRNPDDGNQAGLVSGATELLTNTQDAGAPVVPSKSSVNAAAEAKEAEVKIEATASDLMNRDMLYLS